MLILSLDDKYSSAVSKLIKRSLFSLLCRRHTATVKPTTQHYRKFRKNTCLVKSSLNRRYGGHPSRHVAITGHSVITALLYEIFMTTPIITTTISLYFVIGGSGGVEFLMLLTIAKSFQDYVSALKSKIHSK